MTTAAVELWGRRIGAVTWDADRELGFFEFEPAFTASGIEIAPLTMPLSREVFTFPEIGRAAFRGLPGLLADSLPDRFGNALIDAWLASRGRDRDSFNPVERLCYTGARGMGALEFVPSIGPPARQSHAIDIAALVRLASEALADRRAFASLIRDDQQPRDAMQQILRVGTSAGGARAKALIAWNRDTGEVRSGQVDHAAGFTPWLLKFDGVTGNRDRELADPQGFGRVEFAYANMAQAAGIEMTECRLLEEGGRAHFATRRFDRTDQGAKLHMQSLCAMQHLDFNLPGAHSYEQAVQTIRTLGLPTSQVEQQVRRAAFNVVARNQDDHTKNIAFLMDKSGQWSLSPAFDVTYAFNPSGAWTSRHQMSLGGKRDQFDRSDFDALGRFASLKRGRALAILDVVIEAVSKWPAFAEAAEVPPEMAQPIQATHRARELAD